MNTFIVNFRLQEQHEIPGVDQANVTDITNLLVSKMQEGELILDGWHEWDGGEIDNPAEHCDDLDTDEVYFEVVLDIDEPEVDQHDGGESVYHYVYEALQERSAELSNCHSIENGDKCRTIVHLTLTDAEKKSA